MVISLKNNVVSDLVQMLCEHTADTTCRQGFTCGNTIDASALHHMHYHHCDYTPHLGRFLLRDPLSYIGGLNIYGYVRSNPTMALAKVLSI